jgi:hypothetical protein
MGRGGLPRAVVQKAGWATAWQPSPVRETAYAALCNVRGTAWWRARRRQGITGDLEGGTGEVSSRKERAGAHRNGVLTVRRRKRRRAAAINDGGVAPVVIDERGEVLQLEGDPTVRRQRSIEEWSSSEGAHRRGADDGDARTESSAEEGLRWRKTGEEDVWAMGMSARRSGVDGRDERRVG